jgi:TRAP transporter TAXI family solute receptor
MPIRLIDIADYVGPLKKRYQAFYEERTILASTYGLAGSVRTIGVPNFLVVNASMPADRAYALTRMLFTQRDALALVHPEALHLNRRSAIATDPLPLHPGAARYYRESKQWS